MCRPASRLACFDKKPILLPYNQDTYTLLVGGRNNSSRVSLRFSLALSLPVSIIDHERLEGGSLRAIKQQKQGNRREKRISIGSIGGARFFKQGAAALGAGRASLVSGLLTHLRA